MYCVYETGLPGPLPGALPCGEGCLNVENYTDEGKMYTEAWVGDVIEGSVVPAPGFLDTTAKFAEAFGHKKKEARGDTDEDTKKDGQAQNLYGKDYDQLDRKKQIEIDKWYKKNFEGLIRPADGATKKDMEEDVSTSTADGAMPDEIIKKNFAFFAFIR